MENRDRTRKGGEQPGGRGERAPSDRRIHYPGLLVILERSLRATALDALEEYKTRGSWVPGTPRFYSRHFFLHFAPRPLPRPCPFLSLDTCSFTMDLNPFGGIQVDLSMRHKARFDGSVHYLPELQHRLGCRFRTSNVVYFKSFYICIHL